MEKRDLVKQNILVFLTHQKNCGLLYGINFIDNCLLDKQLYHPSPKN